MRKNILFYASLIFLTAFTLAACGKQKNGNGFISTSPSKNKTLDPENDNRGDAASHTCLAVDAAAKTFSFLLNDFQKGTFYAFYCL